MCHAYAEGLLAREGSLEEDYCWCLKQIISNKMVTVREEEQIWACAFRRLEQGRPGDVDHTRRVLNYVKSLMSNF